MTEHHSTAVATLSCGTNLYYKNNFSSELSLPADNNLAPSKILGPNLCEKKHIYQNATKNFICDDMVSGQSNHLVNHDVKAPQAAYLKDVNKEYIEEDDFPHCVLRMLPYTLRKKKDPIVVSVEVKEGTAKIGTPLCMPCRDFVYIGRIAVIKRFRKDADCATERQSVRIRVTCEIGEQPRLRRRNAQAGELLVSCKTKEISRPLDVGSQQPSDAQVTNDSSMDNID